MTIKFVALIPARAGSKGLPKKNLQQIGSSTLVQLAAASAFGAGLSRVYLSTDSEEILRTTLDSFPQTSAIKRSEYSASDRANASDVVSDFLEKAPDITEDTFVVYLQPTSPFRTATHVAAAMSRVDSQDSTGVVSVTEASPNPTKAVQIVHGRIKLFDFSSPTENRQHLPLAFFPNGAIYIFSVKVFRQIGDVPIQGTLPFIMDKLSSLDIDSVDDLGLARIIWSNGARGIN
jgi:CMP-N,N'-diacetyllegionaminic acid synthase